MRKKMKQSLGHKINSKGAVVADAIDIFVMVVLAFFAFMFLHLVLVKSTAGDTEIAEVKTAENALSVLYGIHQGFISREVLGENVATLSDDLAPVSSFDNLLLSGEASILKRNVGGERKITAFQEYLPLEAKKLFSLDWKNTKYIDMVISESVKQGIDPCYGVITMLHESLGDPNAVGNDANVVGCDVHARRILLMQESAHCKSIYPDSNPAFNIFLEDCLRNKRVPKEGNWELPQKGINACLDDLLDLKVYNSPKHTPEEFCSKSGNFKPYLRYGIGLGQATPDANSYEFFVGGKSYTYCELFDPAKNIEALVARLIEKGASTASSPQEIQYVFGGYIGKKTLPQGVKRYQDFLICKEVMARENPIS